MGEIKIITSSLGSVVCTDQQHPVLQSSGLGVSIGILLYLPKIQKAGFLHPIFLPNVDPSQHELGPCDHPVSGFQVLLKEMNIVAEMPSDAQAYLIGGGHLMSPLFSLEDDTENLESLKKLLDEYKISNIKSSVGGFSSRRFLFDARTGECRVFLNAHEEILL